MFKGAIKTLDKEIFGGIKSTDPILEWISSSKAQMGTTSASNLNLKSETNSEMLSNDGSPQRLDGTAVFTSAVIHASVNKDVLAK